MRLITTAILACLATCLQAIGQTAPKVSTHEVLKCVNTDGKACIWTQVSDLAIAATADDGAHKSLAAFGKLTLASFDGTLKCEQTDGTPCTEEQVRSLNRIAAPLNLKLWYRFDDALFKR